MPPKTETKTRKITFPTHILVFLAPAVLVYSIFMVYPLLNSLRLSLFTTGPGGDEVFNGIQNYISLFTSELWQPRFWGALKNNFIFFIVHTLVQNPVGLLLAALLSLRTFRHPGPYRTIYFMPAMLSYVIVGFVWQLILSPIWGVSESLMSLVGLEGLLKPWLGLEGPALIALSLISVWQWVGIPMMLFYAALISIPTETLEAAIVDGASGWKVFWRIKVPLIMPTIGIVTILTFIGNFNAFDLVYVVGGSIAAPNYSTDILGSLFYRTFFGTQLQLGNPTMGATVATMMFLIIPTGVLIYMVAWQRRVVTYDL
jgi:raffinose/stachyose/melibiose transport system permease protein